MTTTIRGSAVRRGVRTDHWYLAPAHAASGIGVATDDAGPIAMVPPKRFRPLGSFSTSLNFVQHQGDTLFADAARGREVLHYALAGGPGPVVAVYKPDYIKAIMTADEAIAPSATHQSPLRPIVGGDSVLTSIGERHRKQRALLLPRFHGRAIAAYQESIDRATDAALATWPVGETIRLGDLSQRITLDIIIAAIFGLPDPRDATAAERAMRKDILFLLRMSTTPIATANQLANAKREEPMGPLKLLLRRIDRKVMGVLAERRAADDAESRDDIMALLLSARTDDGEPLSDREIRDELMTLLLAGHETTANQISWTFERLTRTPDVYRDARDAVRADDTDYLDALLNESMRSRPVVPIVARHLLQPWQFGNTYIQSGMTALISILLLHHRDDLYPRPFAFEPERFLGVRPNPHELMPFGGGIRRCLGAPLAMAELKTVVGEILRRVDLRTTTEPAERARHRNVTMIPQDGGLVHATAVR